MEGSLYLLRVRCPWRDLPEYFSLWNTIYRRFLPAKSRDSHIFCYRTPAKLMTEHMAALAA